MRRLVGDLAMIGALVMAFVVVVFVLTIVLWIAGGYFAYLLRES